MSGVLHRYNTPQSVSQMTKSIAFLRLCSVNKNLLVKVADATLSRDIYELDYWRPGEKLELRPVKWMAPESLDSNHFSTKSDVVSDYLNSLAFLFTYNMLENGNLQKKLNFCK